ncbi:unnamed protein product [Albugo candida]|uniref:Uncharacterized protein n=1 Tax=Albugo candida TaxID=65357 RepID=A0A024GK76_9STRA|nr:unnamed protein product [Albugo candida]|eukprot:CCI47286.1 unnamed protein product [Albugo candida]
MSSAPINLGNLADPIALAEVERLSHQEANQLTAATLEYGDEYASNSRSVGSAPSPLQRASPTHLRTLFEPLTALTSAQNAVAELRDASHYQKQSLSSRVSATLASTSTITTSHRETLFRIRISGIQCRNLKARKLLTGKSDPFVEFYWDDTSEKAPYTTPTIKNDLNPNFKGLLIAFEYRTTLANLHEKLLVIKVFSNRTFQAKTLLGMAKVDLWTIATGPVHHDHHLMGCENGRIVFNCYMEQCSDWNISVSEIGVMMPAISHELDRPEGHDYQEDASLPLKKFGVSYKCTIGTTETFYVGSTLKRATKRPISEVQEVSFQSLARLAVLSSRVSRPHACQLPSNLSSTSSTSTEGVGCSGTGTGSGNTPKAKISAPMSISVSSSGPNSASVTPPVASEPVIEDPVAVKWSSKDDDLPGITRYSTFDELMSATLTLEVRQLNVGRGQISSDPDGGYLLLFEKYYKEMALFCPDVKLDDELRNTQLFGQTWISLEKIFEDAIQERIKRKVDTDIHLDGVHVGPAAGDSSMMDQFVTSRFEQSLTLKGHQMGVIFGTILFNRIPDVRQLRCGVISENGITSSSSVIVGTSNMNLGGRTKAARKLKVIIPIEAQRVLEKTQDLVELMSVRQKDDKDAKVRKATKILKVLQVSHKASMLSWVYGSTEALDETKSILLRLWQFLLENIRVRHYTLRNVFYELLFYLVKRAELSDLPLLGFDSSLAAVNRDASGPKSNSKIAHKHLALGLKLRAMLVETKYCILQTVSVRGVMNNNLMFFVGRMLSVLCFRLPSFGVELYQLWAESYTEPVPELATEFQMSADAHLFAMDGLEAHLDWRRFHKAIYDEYGEKALKGQEEEAEDKYEITTAETWKTRFRRLTGDNNTLNILVVDQWLWYILDTLAVFNQKIGWVHLPGYTQVLKVFFLEMKTQKSGWLPPTLYKLSCTMLSNPSLINPMTKFLLSSTSVHDVTAVIGAVELLGVWMYMIRSWRVRLGSYRLSHLENNDRWNFHQDDQYSIPAGDEVSLLPPSFDFRFLCHALRVLLSSEHTQVVLTTLEFLYNCWDCFPERQADKLRYELLQSFLRLFLHWHREVRHFFQTLIAYRAMKPHGWTQMGASYVNTPPHSRRQMDAVAADFNLSLGTDDACEHSGRRMRSYSANNLLENVQKRLTSSPRTNTGLGSRSGHLTSPRSSAFRASQSPISSPVFTHRASLPGTNITISSPNSTSTSGSSPNSASLLSLGMDRRSVDSVLRAEGRKNSLPSTAEKKARSASEDFIHLALQPQPKMDPNIQLQFNRLLESVYAAANSYIERQRSDGKLVLLRSKQPLATWKKKGTLLKQGFIYKNSWSLKYFSLQNNKLGYADTENGPIKREMNVIGCSVSEVPNQIDQSTGTRVILFYCFSVDSGYQRFVLSAPTFEEQRDWIEVLTQNATTNANDMKQDTRDKAKFGSQWDVTDVFDKLKLLSGKHDPAEDVPDTLMPYTALAVKEWLDFRVDVMEIESKIAAGQSFTMPVLLSKSSIYADDD